MHREAMESSIFYVLGLAYDHNLNFIAFLYKIDVEELKLILRAMQFSTRAIEDLEKRCSFPSGHCLFCGIKCKPYNYCSQHCYMVHRKRRKELEDIVNSRLVPLTKYRNCFYDIEKRVMVRVYDYRTQ